MKSLFFILSGLFLLSLTSCSKSGNSNNYILMPDTGFYIVNTGTITIVGPDSTVTYIAPRDRILCQNVAPPIATFYAFYVSAVKNIKNVNTFTQGFFNMRFKPAPGTYSLYGVNQSNMVNFSSTGYDSQITGPANNAGTIIITNYNTTNGTLVSGSFSGTVTRIGGNANTLLPISGTFDLKLNTK